MEVAFYLKRPEAKKSTAIWARISYHGMKVKYYPSVNIHPKHWNAEKQRARQSNDFPRWRNFNRNLDNVKTTAEDLLDEYQKNNNGRIPSEETLKTLLEARLKLVEVKDDISFITFLQQLIDDSEKGVRLNDKTGKPINANTIKTYKTTRIHLEAFEKKTKREIGFNDVTAVFDKEYKRYLIENQKFTTNTVGKHIQIIKLAMEEAKKIKLHTNLDYESFVVHREDVDAIYLNEEELSAIEKIDFSDNLKYDNVRDLFLIGCHTGLRYSDFSILKPENIINGFIEIKQVKTGDPVSIPVDSTVARIMAKYGGQLPKAYSNQKMNDFLKEIAKKAEGFNQPVEISFTKAGKKVTEISQKWELVSTHTARRSFATNEYLAGTPILSIMAITGHKTEKAFMRYIRLTNKEKAIQMKKAWEERHRAKEAGLLMVA